MKKSSYPMLLLFLVSSNSYAQFDPIGPPPEEKLVDENGVDFVGYFTNNNAMLSHQAIDLSIGKVFDDPSHPRPALELSHQTVNYLWRDSMSYLITYSSPGLPSVYLGTRSIDFVEYPTGVFKNNNSGEALSLNGDIYTYRNKDGMVVHFKYNANGWQIFGQSATGLATDIVFPSGEKQTFWYRMAYVQQYPWPRLQSVTSSFG